MNKENLFDMTPEEYIKNRLKQYQKYYDDNSIISKSRYLTMRALSVVGGAIVPVLVNININNINIITTIISLMVVIFVSLESVYHFREQWKNYRSTEQFLGRELYFYKTRRLCT